MEASLRSRGCRRAALGRSGYISELGSWHKADIIRERSRAVDLQRRDRTMEGKHLQAVKAMSIMSGNIKPKAVLCDVFGTVVNWRLTVTESLKTRAASTLSSPALSLPSATRLQAATVDWSDFAQKWRNSYGEFTQNYTASKSSSGEDSLPFKTVDQHHHDSLISLLDEYQLHGLWSADEIKEISLIWHFLIPWPDSPSGLETINKLGIQTCTLSNGNVSLLTDMAAFAHLPWTHILSSEHFGAYKPAPEVYKGAAKMLGLEPGECAMIAAHLGDLKAARECGLKTIYVERESEETWNKGDVEKAKVEGWTDLWVGLEDGDGDGDRKGFLEIARRLAQ